MRTQWAREIEQRIICCDYLVILLSVDSVGSEMVLGEIRFAYYQQKRNGCPHFLPIRVQYDGELDYELSFYLGRLPYTKWGGNADSEKVLADLLSAMGMADSLSERFGEEPVKEFTLQIGVDQKRPPLYTCDPRLLQIPGGTAKLQDPFYIRRDPDDHVEAAAGRMGETLVIKAPRQMGKSSLAVRHLAACKDRGKRCAYVDFQLLDPNDLETYPRFLNAITVSIVGELDLGLLESTSMPHWEFTRFVEKQVLQTISGEVAIAFDEMDLILGRPYQRDFFAMLRGWHNRRASRPDPWENLNLTLVISTEPYLLIDSANQSPFNVVTPLTLEPFDRDQLGELSKLHGAVLSEGELHYLHDLVGGQPYLSRLAFYRLNASPRLTFSELYETAADPRGMFGDHLRSLLLRLQERPVLVDAMRQVVRYGTTFDDDTFHRLFRAGLVRREGKRIIPANLLYARFFRDLE